MRFSNINIVTGAPIASALPLLILISCGTSYGFIGLEIQPMMLQNISELLDLLVLPSIGLSIDQFL